MNYIEEMNAFNVWITLHPEVSTSAQVLWYVLMHYDNTCSWKKQFSVPMSMLMTSTRLSESSVKRARLALQKAGRIRYSVRPGKKATVYEMISMEEEGIVTSFLSGNSTAIATDISDSEEIDSEEINSEEIGSEEIDSAGVINLAEEKDDKDAVSEEVVSEEDVSEKVISEKVVSEDVAVADAGNADQCTLQNKNQCDMPKEEQCDLQNNDQTISQNEGEHISKNEGQSDCLGERLPELPAERLPERLAERPAERPAERILKLNETKLDISKESTKKGSEAILVEPRKNKLKNAELQSVEHYLINQPVTIVEVVGQGKHNDDRLVQQANYDDVMESLHIEAVEQHEHGSNKTQVMNSRSWQEVPAVTTDTLNSKRIILINVVYLVQMHNSRQKGGLRYETSLGTVVIAPRHSCSLANSGG